jgi:hypothetical protein
MDGRFVPNISFGMPVIRDLRKISGLFFDTHLMIVEPERYVEEFAAAGSDLITVHIEAVKDAKAAIDRIHACGKQAGFAIKPGTDLSAVIPYLPDLEMLLVMSVEPGFGGQSFMADMLPKVTAMLRAYMREALGDDPDPSALLFPSPSTGGPLTERAWDKRIKRHARAAHEKCSAVPTDAAFHMLRHFVAGSHMLRASVNPQVTASDAAMPAT